MDVISMALWIEAVSAPSLLLYIRRRSSPFIVWAFKSNSIRIWWNGIVGGGYEKTSVTPGIDRKRISRAILKSIVTNSLKVFKVVYNKSDDKNSLYHNILSRYGGWGK